MHASMVYMCVCEHTCMTLYGYHSYLAHSKWSMYNNIITMYVHMYVVYIQSALQAIGVASFPG